MRGGSKRAKRPNLIKINPRKDEAQRVRGQMNKAARAMWRHLDADVAGFALVAWDRRAGAASAVSTDSGPISRSLLPTYVHDVLNRMEAVDLAQTAEVEGLD